MKTLTENLASLFLYALLIVGALLLYWKAPDIATPLREKLERTTEVRELR